MKLFFLLVAALSAVSAIRYDGYRLLEVGPVNDMKLLKQFVALCDKDERIRQVILLNELVRVSKPLQVAVAPAAYQRIAQFLDTKSIQFTVVNTDLQKTFDENMAANELAKSKWRSAGSRVAPDAYLRYDEQVAWMQDTAAASPIAETFNIGQTYEGRDTIGISINEGNTALPAIWVDSNLHAREWITAATNLYIIDEILFGTSAEAIEMRTNYRWYILPMANPDGYEFTYTDRMWRKTRSDNAGSLCIGVDGNRNWDENWGGPGASDNPCADDYHGPSAFSEVETANMRDKLAEISGFTNLMITNHAYSQYWLVPWGGYEYKPADYDELMRVAYAATDAIQAVNGLRFEAGTPPDLLYVASGGSFDYTKAQLGMVYSYATEMRPATQAQGGFDIPPSNIYPSGAEIFAAVVACAREAQHKL